MRLMYRVSSRSLRSRDLAGASLVVNGAFCKASSISSLGHLRVATNMFLELVGFIVHPACTIMATEASSNRSPQIGCMAAADSHTTSVSHSLDLGDSAVRLPKEYEPSAWSDAQSEFDGPDEYVPRRPVSIIFSLFSQSVFGRGRGLGATNSNGGRYEVQGGRRRGIWKSRNT